MLTPSDKRNIQNFKSLKKNHQRVFRHRLKRKFKGYAKDLEFILLYHNTLKLNLEKVVSMEDLSFLLNLYETQKKLQNR